MNHKFLLVICINIFFSFTVLGQSINRGPYLQKGTPTSVVVKWRTDTSTSSVIEYSTNTSYNLSLSETTPKTDHELEITGLSPGTKYFYRIGTGGALLSGNTDLYFKTHPAIGTSDPYTFWLLGHTGNGGLSDVNAVNVRNAYYNYIGNNVTDAIIVTGDNAGYFNNQADYQTYYFDMFDSKLKNTIGWSCIGNLEGNSVPFGTQTGPYYDIFTFPTLGESGGIQSNTESYYSFDYGNIHFIVLNSFDEDRSVGSTMYNWAESDIQSTTQKWIVAIWHHPPYSKGYHPSEGFDRFGNPAEQELIDMRQNFNPLMENYGVDLVIGGHTESYERSYFIDGHYGESASFDPSTHIVGANGGGSGQTTGGNATGAYSKPTTGADAGKGTVYVVNSTASQTVSGLPLDHNAMYYSVSQHGSCVLEVDGDNLTLKFLRNTGAIDDFFTIEKTGASQTWYQDLDSDTYGNPAITQDAASQPAGYVSDNTDCDDTDASVNPGATEVPYNGIDDDCDPLTLDDDLDGDTYNNTTDCDDTDSAVNPGATEIPYNGIDDDCDPLTLDDDLDGDTYNNATDCDDTDSAVNPGATEIPYNGIDDDCDPLTLDDDLDGDTYNNATDCDDTDAAVNPGATEIPYNGIDDDCDPLTLDDDLDGDTYNNATDCDDTDASVNPGATEVPYNGIDDDCDPLTLDDDLDGDTYNNATDCDDTDASVNPGATEVPYNGIDDDCDPLTLDDDLDGDTYNNATDCDDTDAAVNPGATEIPYNGIDDDCDPLTLDDDLDGDTYNNATDCDDTDSAVNPGATEIPYNGIDDDCDPLTLDDDLDGDTYNNATDCDDTDASVNPGATEIPYNGIDDDCDPLTLDDDLDGDTYNNATDCDDTDASVNPGATEIPYNGIDDDCDPLTLDDDLDGDTYNNATDCDDTDAAVNPGATEVPYNGIDDDCDPLTLDDDLDGDTYNNTTDCDDTDSAVNPGATEIPYNGIDDDCDPLTLDDDLDGDTYNNATDCDDTDSAVNPGATEIPYNGIDDDCDPLTLDDDLDGDNYIIAPNPFNNEIIINKVPLSYNNTAFSIKIFDLKGRLVIDKEYLCSNGIINVTEMDSLEQAQYLIKITSLKDGNSIFKPLIKY